MDERWIKELQEVVNDMEGDIDPFCVGPYMKDLQKIIEGMKQEGVSDASDAKVLNENFAIREEGTNVLIITSPLTRITIRIAEHEKREEIVVQAARIGSDLTDPVVHENLGHFGHFVWMAVVRS